MTHDPMTPMQKGHFIHGSGTATVYHNRAIASVDGRWPIFVTHQADAALTISGEGANSFIVNCSGNWKIALSFESEVES